LGFPALRRFFLFSISFFFDLRRRKSHFFFFWTFPPRDFFFFPSPFFVFKPAAPQVEQNTTCDNFNNFVAVRVSVELRRRKSEKSLIIIQFLFSIASY